MKDGPRKPPGGADLIRADREGKSAYPILRSLEDAMEREPHLRVGQLLVNAVPLDRDLFYVEDDELEAYLEAFVPKED